MYLETEGVKMIRELQRINHSSISFEKSKNKNKDVYNNDKVKKEFSSKTEANDLSIVKDKIY